MENIEFNTKNLTPLSQEELVVIKGGEPITAAIGIGLGILAVGLWVASEWDCLVEGYNEVRD